MPTPLYSMLKDLASSHPVQLNMPGHHGRLFPAEDLLSPAFDVTENQVTGDLFGAGKDAIEEAEKLWAECFEFDSCLFLTGGSTQGIYTGMSLLAGTDSTIALDRGSHKSAYHAMALLNLNPYYLPRPWMEEEGVVGPVDPVEVEKILQDHPEIRMVFLTSPTYYGVMSDIPQISQICHQRGVLLMVDAAHGAHLPFLGYHDYQMADVVVISAHKTLPCVGQSALIFANHISMTELRRTGSLYGSSSPSYLMMGSLDLVRDWMEQEGAERYMEVTKYVQDLRSRFPSLRPGKLRLDPARLTLICKDGYDMEKKMQQKNVFPEMADLNHVVMILTAADDQTVFRDLVQILNSQASEEEFLEIPKIPHPPEFPKRVLPIRKALFAPSETVPLEKSCGRICASQVSLYPPGIPVIAPGERITKKHLAYLNRIGYNKTEIDVILPSIPEEEGPHETDYRHY